MWGEGKESFCRAQKGENLSMSEPCPYKSKIVADPWATFKQVVVYSLEKTDGYGWPTGTMNHLVRIVKKFIEEEQWVSPSVWEIVRQTKHTILPTPLVEAVDLCLEYSRHSFMYHPKHSARILARSKHPSVWDEDQEEVGRRLPHLWLALYEKEKGWGSGLKDWSLVWRRIPNCTKEAFNVYMPLDKYSQLHGVTARGRTRQFEGWKSKEDRERYIMTVLCQILIPRALRGMGPFGNPKRLFHKGVDSFSPIRKIATRVPTEEIPLFTLPEDTLYMWKLYKEFL